MHSVTHKLRQRNKQILNNQTEGAKNIIKQQKENTNMYEIDKMKKKKDGKTEKKINKINVHAFS